MMKLRRYGCFLLVILLAGCAQGLNLGIASVQPDQVDTETIRQEILLSKEVYGVSDRLQKREVIRTEKVQQASKVEPLIKQLRGLSEQGILDLLGRPLRQLHQGNVYIWQYLTAACQWDLYFVRRGGERVFGINDLIIHQAGKIVTDAKTIVLCEKELRANREAVQRS